MLSIADIRPWLIFECVSGSRAYGTDTPESDTDLKGVFVLPPERFYGLATVDQVSDESHDSTYYELRRFADLIGKNNPNLLEMLFADEAATLQSNPLFAKFTPEMVLSKRCKHTFAGYALGQIQKARGLNKKIVNPIEKERKHAIDFCYVLCGQGSVPLLDWLEEKRIPQEKCGLVKIPHMRDTYGVYFDPSHPDRYRGVFASEEATEVRASSVPIDAEPLAWMAFNRDGFKKHCKEYTSYWDWVANRNEARYAVNTEHGRNYDSKNMMHTFRLLDMAEEIARDQTLTVRRPNREELMRIRSGEFEYEDLLDRAERRLGEIDTLYAESPLRDEPDVEGIERVLVEIRCEVYASSC